ncbi:hypothetical protein [Poseidonocella sedimentorum]|uniref:Uncharacterized protein n=1 Tax=Poseidonocella sedimentorum TaxID=871652 RepID=A0A1I6DGD7_9RHOB|nr:hypothetical protein [Poseidonocella sedimentorum]SFR04540.1 hypothetical protein SAMN04515673_103195 [Poseidonocella sedimentorum]
MTTHFRQFICAETAIYVGTLPCLRKSGLAAKLRVPLERVGFEDLTPELVTLNCPAVIFAPLFCSEFDAIELAQRLAELGFTGLFRPVCQPLPKPEMVEREIRAMAPGLDVKLYELHETPRHQLALVDA